MTSRPSDPSHSFNLINRALDKWLILCFIQTLNPTALILMRMIRIHEYIRCNALTYQAVCMILTYNNSYLDFLSVRLYSAVSLFCSLTYWTSMNCTNCNPLTSPKIYKTLGFEKWIVNPHSISMTGCSDVAHVLRRMWHDLTASSRYHEGRRGNDHHCSLTSLTIAYTQSFVNLLWFNETISYYFPIS